MATFTVTRFAPDGTPNVAAEHSGENGGAQAHAAFSALIPVLEPGERLEVRRGDGALFWSHG